MCVPVCTTPGYVHRVETIPPPVAPVIVSGISSLLEKANTRSNSLSTDLAQKNKLVDNIAELQRTTGEVRFKMKRKCSVCHIR